MADGVALLYLADGTFTTVRIFTEDICSNRGVDCCFVFKTRIQTLTLSHGRLTRNTRERSSRIRLLNNVNDYPWSKARFPWPHTISKRSESQDLVVSGCVYTLVEWGCDKRLHFYSSENRSETRPAFLRVVLWPHLPLEKATFTNIKWVWNKCYILFTKILKCLKENLLLKGL